MGKDLDEKISSLVREADDLFGMYDADSIYKKPLNDMILHTEKCNFLRAFGNLREILDGTSREIDDYRKAQQYSGVELGSEGMLKIQRTHRLENETLQAFKFLLNEKCGCKLK